MYKGNMYVLLTNNLILFKNVLKIMIIILTSHFCDQFLSEYYTLFNVLPVFSHAIQYIDDTIVLYA